MRKRNKKKWTTPLLTVVVRGKPEEMVLIACKAYWGCGAHVGGTVGFYATCCANPHSYYSCTVCSGCSTS